MSQRTRLPARALALWFALGALGASRAALASPPPSEADTLFEAGRVAAEHGDFATACPKFAESQRLDPGAGTLMNLADCEERSGRLVEAWQHWQQAIAQLGAKDDRVAFATRRAAALEPQVPRLVLHLLAGTPPGTHLKCDDVDLGSPELKPGISFTSAPLPLNPGEHVVLVDAPGRRAQEFRVTLRLREHRSMDVAPGDAVAPEAPLRATMTPTSAIPPAPSGAAGRVSPIGLVAGGAGIVALAVAAVAGAETIRLKNIVTDHCNAARACDGQGLEAGSSGKTMSAVSTVAFVAGVAGIGAGLYFVLIDAKNSAPKASLGMLGSGAVGLRGAF